MNSLTAHAKLTLLLRITGVRDDGYHLIDAEMISLDLADGIVVTPDHSGIDVDGEFADGVPTDDTNLVSKALLLADISAHVRITKNIPHGGGLGGGSTDAAAVLRWAEFTDVVAASRLGADIPFCMVGGRARVRGIGEIVEPLPRREVDITLVIPPLHASTPQVYAAWDAMGGPHHESGNDLEPAALHVVPGLSDIKRRITEVVKTPPMLAGSGSTWFVEGHHRELLSALPDCRVVFTRAL
ncbi:MAG: 4-(cytidine 5'-diphospho)-2-C-methyl-D-erythritol kinase [Actinomycetota bacterium]